MSKLRIAVLEDDPVILDHLVSSLKALDTVLVVTAQEDAMKFRERVRATAPDALILDIEIHGNEQAGLDIAREFELPVIFISGRIADDLLKIEKLQRLREQVPVEHLSKSERFDPLDFRMAMSRFIRLIDATKAPTIVNLALLNREHLPIRMEDIVAIETPDDKAQAQGNNRWVYFTHRPPVLAANLSMTEEALVASGFPKQSMLRISKSTCVNPDRVMRWSPASIQVECVDGNKVVRTRVLAVGTAYKNAVEARLKGMA
jgi:DNA-binding LytR/AlgR family response regulator